MHSVPVCTYTYSWGEAMVKCFVDWPRASLTQLHLNGHTEIWSVCVCCAFCVLALAHIHQFWTETMTNPTTTPCGLKHGHSVVAAERTWIHTRPPTLTFTTSVQSFQGPLQGQLSNPHNTTVLFLVGNVIHTWKINHRVQSGLTAYFSFKYNTVYMYVYMNAEQHLTYV